MARKPLHPKQVAAIMALDGPERVEHTIKRIADWEEVWGLYDDGWAMTALDDDPESTMFPIWPDPEYAETCADGEWASYTAQAIPLGHLLDVILPNLEEDGALVSLFRLPNGDSVPLTPANFRELVESELEN
jgi:hypothetical protein